jgi:hypothetical protein
MTDTLALYRRFYAELPADDLQRQVWDGTPHIVSVFTGDDRRYREIAEHCYAAYGREAFPFGPVPTPGRWRRGNATVFGWTWIGFADPGDAEAVLAAWPAPEGVVE